MTNPDPVRWGVLSTANIARAAFLPALRAAGGVAAAVAGRDLARAKRFAADNGVERAVEGYETLLGDDSIEAIYIPLPNALHAEWTIKALEAGKTVLCEKPLCVSVEETEQVLAAARRTGNDLWEAFVFPFHEQMRRIGDAIGAGDIGQVLEIQSGFHFHLRSQENIRLDPDLGGGALFDVGCYPVHFAGQLWESAPESALATARFTPRGVDEEMQGVLLYEAGNLVFSCGFRRPNDTFTRVLGNEGEIRTTNPFHPGPDDTCEIRRTGKASSAEPAGGNEPSFTAAVRHINSVIRGREAPRHLATEDSLRTAVAMALAQQAAGTAAP